MSCDKKDRERETSGRICFAKSTPKTLESRLNKKENPHKNFSAVIVCLHRNLLQSQLQFGAMLDYFVIPLNVDYLQTFQMDAQRSC